MNEERRFLDKAKSITVKAICAVVLSWIVWVTGNTIMHGKDIVGIKIENKNLVENVVYIRNRIDRALETNKD